MNDYLGRAVEREIATVPAVRPALPSLFDPGKSSAIITGLEPDRPSEGDPSRVTQDEAKPKISSLPERLTAVDALCMNAASATPVPGKREKGVAKTSPVFAEARAVPSAPAAFSTESSPAKQEQLSVGAPIEPVVRPTAEATPPPLQTLAATIDRRTTEMPPRPFQTTAEPVIRPTAEAPPRPPQAAAAPVVRRAAQLPPEEPRVVPAIGEDASTSQTAPAARPAPESTEAKFEKPPGTIPLTQVVAPAHAAIPRISPAPSSPERARNSDNTASPRAIHITIGRIEVRAVHPPPAPLPQPRPAPASPKISLEEYLKQRNGGRR